MKNNSQRTVLIVKNILLILVLYTIAVGIQVALFMLIQKISVPYDTQMPMLWTIGAMLVCIIIFILINKIRFIRFTKKYKNMQRYIENVEEFEHRYEETQKDYLASEKKVMKKKNRIIVMKVLLSIFFMLIAMFCAAGAKKDREKDLLELFVAIGVVFIFLAPLFWIDLFMPFQVANEYQMKELAEGYYPELYQVVKEAAKTLGCNKPIKMYPVYNSGISVSSSANCIHICLDCEEIALLTRDELYQTMLHEIAHVVNYDTKRSRRLEHFSYGMEHFGSLSTRLFFSAEYINFTFVKVIYNLSCTRFYEQLADESVKKYGNGQTYINGLAKSMFLVLFRNCYKPKVDFDVYENESIPADYFFKHLEYYKEYLPLYFDKWDFILRNRILSRQDTHPTFAMRMKNMGVEDYDYTQVETQEQIIKEQQQLLELGCKLLTETATQYRMTRDQYYLPTKAKFEEYQSLVARGDMLTNQQKTEYLSTLFDINREECLKLCDEVLAENPKNAYANLFKGFIFADLLDKRCIEYLYTAASENFNFTENALECIGEFACNVGDEELLQQYRKRTKQEIVEMMGQKEKATLHDGETFTVNLLGNKEFNEILEYIINVGEEVLLNVYSVSRDDGESMLTCYLLEWEPHAEFSNTEEVYNKVFSYLDRYDNGTTEYDFELRDIFSGRKLMDKECNKIAKQMKQTKGALIYSKSEGKVIR